MYILPLFFASRYCGSLSRDECNSAVCGGDPGDFLVRDRTAQPGKMVIVINDYGSPANYQVGTIAATHYSIP